jgi:hypothetical protein
MGGLRLKVEILLLIGCEDGDDGGVDPRFWRAAGRGGNVSVRLEFRHGRRRWRLGGGNAEIGVFGGRGRFLADPDERRKRQSQTTRDGTGSARMRGPLYILLRKERHSSNGAIAFRFVHMPPFLFYYVTAASTGV